MPKKMSEEVKNRIAEAQKARWAAKKALTFEDTAKITVAKVGLPAPPAAPPPPDPTVIAFRQQLVPLVEKREIVQQHVRQAQRQMQEAQMALQEHQQALQDTENAIQYRLNMIGQLTGQPAMPPMPQSSYGLGYPQQTILENLQYQRPDPQPVLAPAYQGEVPSLQGNPNIPAWLTSIPAPQNLRYSSGFVESGPGNPRSESAEDIRNAPETGELARAIVAQRKAQAAV